MMMVAQNDYIYIYICIYHFRGLKGVFLLLVAAVGLMVSLSFQRCVNMAWLKIMKL